MQPSNLKLYLLSIITGVTTGALATFFRWLIVKSYYFRQYIFSEDINFFLIIPIVFSIWGILMGINYLKNRVPYVSGSGIPQSMAAVIGRYKFSRPFRLLWAKFVAGLATMGLGMTLGKEGPSMQLGAVCGTIVGNNFNATPVEKRYLIASGAGAGLAAAFTTPLAPVFFIIENMQGWGSLKIMLPTLLASLCGGYYAGMIFDNKEIHSAVLSFPDYDASVMLVILLFFSLFGYIIARAFSFSIVRMKNYILEIKYPRWIKILFVSAITFIMGTAFLDVTAGGEKELIYQLHNNSSSLGYLFLLILVIIFTSSLAYGINLSGGLILPVLVLGAISGKAYALILLKMGIITVAEIPYFMFIGMSLMFIATNGAPITGLIITIEITGKYQLLVPLIIVATIIILLNQLFNVTPLIKKIYAMMIKSKFEKGLTYDASFEINSNSYFEGKKYSSIKLPPDIEIIKAYRIDRKTKKRYEIGPRTNLVSGDIIEVAMDAESYERLYLIMSAYCNE